MPSTRDNAVRGGSAIQVMLAGHAGFATHVDEVFAAGGDHAMLVADVRFEPAMRRIECEATVAP